MWTQLKNNDFFKKQTPAPLFFLQEKRKRTEASKEAKDEPRESHKSKGKKE